MRQRDKKRGQIKKNEREETKRKRTLKYSKKEKTRLNIIAEKGERNRQGKQRIKACVSRRVRVKSITKEGVSECGI